MCHCRYKADSDIHNMIHHSTLHNLIFSSIAFQMIPKVSLRIVLNINTADRELEGVDIKELHIKR